MYAFALVLLFATDLIAQDFEVVDFVEAIDNGEGRLGQQIGGFKNFGCISGGSININNVDFSLHWGRWQWRASAAGEWQDVADSQQDTGLCGLDVAAMPGGQYRWTAHLVKGDRLIATKPIDVEGAPTAIETATWGEIKSGNGI